MSLSNDQVPVKGRSGATIMETVMAVSVSTILFLFVMMGYSSFVKMAGMQKQDTLVQNELMDAYRFLEKDIRMSGFNVPGNGIYPTITAGANDELELLYNEKETTTKLRVAAQPGDSILVVDDYKGVHPDQWICLRQNSAIGYYQIKSINVGSDTIPDTLRLKKAVSTSWDNAQTNVYFAKSARWSIGSASGLNSLERETLTNKYGFSTIDSIKISVQDSSGNPVAAPFTQGTSLGIRLVGHNGQVAKNSFFSKSFFVKLRNCL
jgi:Tfp pilus assembly protein PilE